MRFLHYSLILTSVSLILLGIQNLGGLSNLDVILFSLSLLVAMCVPLNKRGHYYLVAIIISLALIATITYSLMVGVGLMDAGILAYPIFILLTAFFFNTTAAFVSALLSITSVFYIFYLEQQGRFEQSGWDSSTQFMIIAIMLAATGVIVYLIVSNWRSIVDSLYQAYDDTLEGWAKALELRDQETEGHSQRVTHLVLQLAESMDISGKRLQDIRRGALLHDIGKMALPDEVLLKPGLLTPDERLLVNEHPVRAVTMLEGIPFLKPALTIPRFHHERWDGSGYPDGLVGEEIPLEARLFAVVDVWDALISDRPYRPAWSEVKAFGYIIENAGVLFDSRCVEAFSRVVPPTVGFEVSSEPDLQES